MKKTETEIEQAWNRKLIDSGRGYFAGGYSHSPISRRERHKLVNARLKAERNAHPHPKLLPLTNHRGNLYAIKRKRSFTAGTDNPWQFAHVGRQKPVIWLRKVTGIAIDAKLLVLSYDKIRTVMYDLKWQEQRYDYVIERVV